MTITDLDLAHHLYTKGQKVTDLFLKAGMCKSQTEARNFIKNGGLSLNDTKLQDQNAKFHLMDNNEMLIIEKIGDDFLCWSTPIVKDVK